MKRRLNPTLILLNELPPEGREYLYDRDGAELDSALADLIADNPYSIRLQVRPIGNAFEVQGEVQTRLNLRCSLCAFDLSFPVLEKVREVLIIQAPLSKGDQNVRTNHSSEWDSGAPEAVYLEGETFDVAAFVHELIAITEPIRPVQSADCEKGACPNLREQPQREWLSVGANDSKQIRNHPFASLGKIKLKS